MTPMNNHIENRLWAAADQLWANSSLKPSEYSVPVLGLISLKYADYKFGKVASEISSKYSTSSRRAPSKVDFQSRIGLFIPDTARFSYLQKLPEGDDIGKAINEAMKAIEAENEDLKDVLPKNYQKIDNPTLFELLRVLSSIPNDIEWHVFGYGLKEGFKFWKRRPLAWDEANHMAGLPDSEKPLSPEILDAVVKKYHYYIIGFDLPEDFALLGCVIYLGVTNMPLLMKTGLAFLGFPG